MPTEVTAATDQKTQLIAYLDAQRAAALAVVGGLDERALNTSVVSSGWTPQGLIEHLCGAERYWLHYVLTGHLDPVPWESLPSPTGEFTGSTTPDTAFAYYREVCATSNANLAEVELDANPGRAPTGDECYAVDVRAMLLHMIEETARHAGHLDIARELIDGTVGLGRDERADHCARRRTARAAIPPIGPPARTRDPRRAGRGHPARADTAQPVVAAGPAAAHHPGGRTLLVRGGGGR